MKRPPVVQTPTQHDALTARVHVESRLGRKLVVCLACKQKKPPRGGWVASCPNDRRVFIGDAGA
jgi:hypothetical protein